MRTVLKFFALAATVFLTGCTSGAMVPKDVFDAMAERDYRDDPEFSARIEQLAQGSAPAIVILVEEKDALGALYQVQSRNGVTTWLSADNSMIVLDHGLLTATRGLGSDLMEARSVEAASLILTMKEGHATRHYGHLNGRDEIQPTTFTCTTRNRGARNIVIGETTFRTQLMREHCESESASIKNLYWVSLNGKGILQSRQWVSPDVGMISVRYNL